MEILGKETDQLLNELISIGNARLGDGKSIFSGFMTRSDPFRVNRGRMGDKGDVVLSVDYVGDIGKKSAELTELLILRHTLRLYNFKSLRI